MNSCLDELLAFDIFYFVCYSLMLSYYYTNEYKSRCDFYNHLSQFEFQQSYKNFLSRLPNGILLLDKSSNDPVFYNCFMEKLVTTKGIRIRHNSLTQEPKDETIAEDTKKVQKI